MRNKSRTKAPRTAIPFGIRGKFFFENNSHWIGIMLVIAIPGAAYFFGFFGIPVLDILNNPVFTAMLGFIAATVSQGYFQRKQYETEAAIQRKSELYAPLYDEMVKLREVFKAHPFPESYSLTAKSVGPFAKDSHWKDIGDDSRWFDVPEYIVDMYDTLTRLHNNYVAFFEKASSEVENVINDLALESCDAVIAGNSTGRRIIRGGLMLAENKRDLYHDFVFHQQFVSPENQGRSRDGYSIVIDIPADRKEKLANAIYIRLAELDLVAPLEAARKRYYNYIETCLQTLYIISTQIDRVYGRHRTEF